MMAIPLKWLPYLLTLVGLITLATGGTDVTVGLVMTAIGGIMLYFKYKK